MVGACSATGSSLSRRPTEASTAGSWDVATAAVLAFFGASFFVTFTSNRLEGDGSGRAGLRGEDRKCAREDPPEGLLEAAGVGETSLPVLAATLLPRPSSRLSLEAPDLPASWELGPLELSTLGNLAGAAGLTSHLLGGRPTGRFAAGPAFFVPLDGAAFAPDPFLGGTAIPRFGLRSCFEAFATFAFFGAMIFEQGWPVGWLDAGLG